MRLDRILTLFFIVVALSTLLTFAYVVSNPVSEKFTEFYILGASGKADYPSQVKRAETVTLTLVVINREQTTTTYRVEVRMNGTAIDRAGPVVLEHERQWEQKVSFTPNQVGQQKVEFVLYRNNETEPLLQPIYIRLNVRE